MTVGERYRSARSRLEPILGGLDEAAWDTPVAACPGWRVRDVLAHLVGIIEDAVAGRIDGPPAPELTREEVERHRGDRPQDLLRSWTEMAPFFEEALSRGERWPAFLDVLSHEHDIRGALGLGGARDHDDVLTAAALLLSGLPSDVSVVAGDLASPGGPASTADLETTPFEVLRLRLGRRSRAQVLALDWRGDPEPIVDALFIFGPASADLVE